jgi:hypothetical protein
MTTREDFDRLGNLLGEACEVAAASSGTVMGSSEPSRPAGEESDRAARDLPGDPTRLVALVWPEVVGADVAANAHPLQLRRGRLVVSASSSVWAHTLQYMGEDMRARLNERLGPGAIEQIVFRHAGWEERPQREQGEPSVPGQRQPAVLSEQQREALARLEELDLPRQVREQIARAMTAAFVRGEQDSVR